MKSARVGSGRFWPLAGRALRSVGAVALLASWAGIAPWAGEAKDSCVECHSDADLLVQNKKLYDYYLDWELSVHKQEGITCSDCHGGNPEIADKEGAHGREFGEEAQDSAVNFKNIPDTCGQCHDDYLEGYRKSEHFQHLVKAKQEKQGPNCVTCHGSMNTSVLDVTTVREACARCHNDETENHPEIPGEAQAILNNFLTIDRFYRYMNRRLEPAARAAFLEDADPRIHELAVLWHTFDLCDIERDTRALVERMKQKREQLRRQPKQIAPDGKGQGPESPRVP